MMMYWLKQLGATVVFIVTGLALAITATIFTSPIVYRLGISWFNLSERSGLTAEQLQENYSVMLRYLTDPISKVLAMPYFSSSEGGLQHFAEVKFLFMLTFMLAFAGVIVSIFLILWLRKTKQQPWMHHWFWLAIIFPLILLFIIVIAFDKVFLLFHQILFRNDLWLFSPISDPVITVLPEGLFMIFFIAAILFYEIIIYLMRLGVFHQIKPKRRKRSS